MEASASEFEDRVRDLEIEKDRLYRRVLSLREEIFIRDQADVHRNALLLDRVAAAYGLITSRGWRRSRRDPAYKLVRERAQERACSSDDEPPDAVEKLSEADFKALIEDHPEHEERLRDIAYEFGVHLRKAPPKEQAPEEQPAEEPKPPPRSPEDEPPSSD